VLSQDADSCTRVKLMPINGRSHQLRVHMLALGHPILGDGFYAPKSKRLQIHAQTLDLTHPVFHTPMDFHVEPDF